MYDSVFYEGPATITLTYCDKSEIETGSFCVGILKKWTKKEMRRSFYNLI